MAASFLLSPRASSRIAAARDFLLELPEGRPFLVVGHRRHPADRLCHQVAESRGALFGAHRAGFFVLAEALAAPGLAAAGKKPLTPASRRALVARVVHRARGDESLGRFAAVAAGPGLAARLASTFEELRLAGVAPEALGEADPDVGGLYASYVAGLDEARLADRAEAFRAARRRIEPDGGNDGEAAAGPPLGLPTVFLDVPLPDEASRRFAGAFARQAPAFLWTLPLGDEPTAAALRGLGAVPARGSGAGLPSRDETALEAAQRRLFVAGGRQRGRRSKGGLTVVEAPGQAAEAMEASRLLLAEAKTGTRFDRMAVLLPEPESQATRFHEAFRRAGIPAFLEAGARLPHPAGRAFLALLDCALDDVSASRFAEYLSLGQTPRPKRAEPEGGDAPAEPSEPYVAPRRWEALLLDSQVIGGLDRWERRLGLFEEELTAKRNASIDPDEKARLERRRADMERLAETALPIVRRLDALREPRSWEAWAKDLRELAEMALLQPDGVLAALEETAPMAEVDGVELAEVREGLARRLAEVVRRSSGSRYGRVWVGPVESARGLTFEVVVVPGLSERVFPRTIREDPMLLDRLRGRLGPTLAVQNDRSAQERLRLRIAVGAASRRLILTYSSLDLVEGRPQTPSYYLAEAFGAAFGEVPTLQAIRAASGKASEVIPGVRVPKASEASVDAREYGLSRIVAALGSDRRKPRKGAAAFLLREPILDRALRHEYLRAGNKWQSADGFLRPNDETLAALEERRPGVHAYSPTGLETFAVCPYQFFLKNLVRLRPIERPEAAPQLDPLNRGSFVHEVLFHLGQDLRSLAPLRDEDRVAAALERLEARFKEAEARFRERTAPPIRRIWDDEMAGLLGDLREFLRRFAREGIVPLANEISFGLGSRRGLADPDSVAEPVTLPGKLRLHGSIDAVEELPDGRLRVTDFKTGKARYEANADERILFGGRALQPVLYALAYEEMSGRSVASGRLYYSTMRGMFRDVEVDTGAEETRNVFAAFVESLDDAVRRGRFPAAPHQSVGYQVCRYCDYLPVCGPRPAAHHRTKPPGAEALSSLNRVRALP